MSQLETRTHEAPFEVFESTREVVFAAGNKMLGTWVRVANSRALAWLSFLLIYSGPTLFLAARKPLWDDEFFTLYLSSTGNWSDLWAALLTGADQHPPIFYYATHLIFGALGASNITLRLTAIAGFAVLCLCVYEIVSRITNREWGFCAMFVPLASGYYGYSIEGRGYGPELGFVGIAFLMWMLAGSGRRRAVTIPALAVAIAGAVASHYYAVLVLAPLAAGELVRTLERRRIDWPVCLSFASALVPIAAFSRVILSAQAYSAHFWAVPRWRNMASWYMDALGYGFLLVLALSGLALLRLTRRNPQESGLLPRIERSHVVALLTLSAVPILGVLIAKLVTNAFSPRYAIAALPAVCILLTLGLARMQRFAVSGAAILWIGSLIGFAVGAYRIRDGHSLEWENLRDTAAFVREEGTGEVAMSDITRFHRLSFYARRDLAQRLTYLAEPHLSIEYQGFDTVDRGLLALNPWFPLNVRWFREWMSERRSFLVWGFIGKWSWVPNALAELDADVRLKGVLQCCVLFSVSNVTLPPDGRLPEDPTGQPMLYSQMPKEGPPLCTRYLSPSSCPAID
jgi:hypothetical protein